MLIFVYGGDTFRVRQKVGELKTAFLKKFDPTGMNVSFFPSDQRETLDTAEVLQAVCSLPFLSPRRMVVVRGLLEALKKEDESVWIDGLSRVPETTIVILTDAMDVGGLEKKSAFKKLKSLLDVHLYPFSPLQGQELYRWIAAWTKACGGSIDVEAAAELAERIGSDLWAMDQELRKLVAFKKQAMITTSDVQTMVRASFEGEIFALMDALSQKKTTEAIQRLLQERLAGTSDFYLLTMLARQARLLLGARAILDQDPRATSPMVAQELGVHPFVAGKAFAQARGYTFVQLCEIHEAIFRFDLALKSGEATPEVAVDLITAKFVR